jgi:ribonuclease HII
MGLSNSSRRPSFAQERKLGAQGYQWIAGVDEVGRGALAGPVVAAAVILPGKLGARWLREVRESKQLTAARRRLLVRYIEQAAISIGIGSSGCDVIDTCGIVKATRLAMKQAIDRLSPPPQYLLIDYIRLPESPLPQIGVLDGDSLCFSIACASIVAKVARDNLMVEFEGTYPGYGLARHKGYGTEGHLACLRRLGPSPIHRRSFRSVRELVQR